MNAVDEIQQRALAEIEASRNLQHLDDLRVQYLGKKGEITAQLKTLGGMEPEQRKSFGQAVNAIRDALNQAITARRTAMEGAALEEKLLSEKVDVTLPGRSEQRGGLHPVTRAMDRAVGIFTGLGFDVAVGPEVEDDHYNFEALNFPPHHPARAMHDTFYFGDGRLLRTHTSPVQVRVFEKRRPPVRILAPGRSYRNEAINDGFPVLIPGKVVVSNKKPTDALFEIRSYEGFNVVCRSPTGFPALHIDDRAKAALIGTAASCIKTR